jgi:hypothetical protein
MPDTTSRYFFNLHVGRHVIRDGVGDELAGERAARARALRVARRLGSLRVLGPERRGMLEIADGEGRVIDRLSLRPPGRVGAQDPNRSGRLLG